MAVVATLAKVAVGYARSRSLLKGAADEDDEQRAVDAERARALLDRASEGREKVERLASDLRDGKGKERLRNLVREQAGRRLPERLKAPDSDPAPSASEPVDSEVTVQTASDSEADLGVNAMMTALSGAAAETGETIGDLLDTYNSGAPVPEAEKSAALILRAILMAAKADGEIDAEEKEVILGSLGANPDPADRALVQELLAEPLDVAALAQATPASQIVQIYTAALMAVRLDTPPEAVFLHRLAEGLGMGERVVNALHAQMGRPLLYVQD
ncbi:DUF533 domain-containing protein [Sedimentitalea sp. JM2-8]|uniref:DUF533 domain-containing protein n=1 Tax=Sedimentitalea xiamensis TaxID=3050037 RepID=A0ABT7FDE5_9RHOB|nr:DUF533 domain-containing protein [Sedimentitalea xiamensis]MDK3073080.1 DUF533 domain-containing protein [Sedimentitalea xiamensis]